MGNPPAQVTADLGDANFAYIESSDRSDVSRATLQVTALRDALGKVQANVVSTAGGWVIEADAGAPDPPHQAAEEEAA